MRTSLLRLRRPVASKSAKKTIAKGKTGVQAPAVGGDTPHRGQIRNSSPAVGSETPAIVLLSSTS